MKIIALNGHKNCGKVKIAEKWDKNKNVTFVKPYSDNNKPLDYIVTDKDDLSFMVDNNIEVASTVVNEHIYAYFDEQFKNDFNVVCVDDIILRQLMESDYDVVTVFVDNPKSEPSDRVEKLYEKNWYQYIYNYGLDDYDEFLEGLAYDVEIVQQRN